MGYLLDTFGVAVPIIAILAIVLILILIGYVKAPPDTAFIISGFKKEPRVLIGRAGIKIPFLERLDKLSLKQVTIDIKTDGFIPTLDFINIQVDAVAKVEISQDPTLIKVAMKHFLNKKTEEIITDLKDTLQGNMREIIGTLSLKTISNSRDEFGNQVQSKASVDMERLGIRILSCNIQNVEDESGLIKDMGMDNTSKIKKDAAIAKAEADRDISISQAEADKQANDARIKADLEISQKNNELAIKKAELKKEADTRQAEADAAYEIQKEAQRKTIEVATEDANIAKQERVVKLREQEVEVKVRTLEAEVKKQAEAEKFAAQQKADAELYKRQKDAEARKFEMEKDAEAQKTKSEAERYAKEQEATAIRAVGLAEAEAIEKKGLAEAAAMEKKAEAYQKYNNAAMAEMLINILPDIAGKIAEPLSQIDKITIIGGGEGSSGVDQVSGNVPAVMTKLFESMRETVGIDLGEIMKASTYDAKVTRNLNITGLEKAEEETVSASREAVIASQLSTQEDDD